MIFEFEITSTESADFSRLIKIKEDQTFLELHNAIQRCVGYDDSQLASFYILDAMGQRNKEISLFEMADEEDEIDNFVMDVTMIKEAFKGDEKSLVYVFDFFGDRFFTLSLVDKSAEELIDYPICTLCLGDAPEQISEDQSLFMEEEIADKKSDKIDDYLNDPYLMDEPDENVEFENLDDYQDIL